ncbi:hypothetical protein AAK979_06160, partial [Ileibacterium valens]|uniref:hypothetical protein n=2 Tax=Ileibacterium valens TaxID=1862668 RepID=UPI003512BD2B
PELPVSFSSWCIMVIRHNEKSSSFVVDNLPTVTGGFNPVKYKELTQENRLDQADKTVSVHEGLYLSDDPNDQNWDYAWSSRMKISALTEKKDLDAVLMDRRDFDILAGGGLLADLDKLLEADPLLKESLRPYLEDNTEIKNLRSPDLLFEENPDETDIEEISYPMALRLQDSEAVQKMQLDGEIYLGILKNSLRTSESLDFIRLWMDEDNKSASE